MSIGGRLKSYERVQPARQTGEGLLSHYQRQLRYIAARRRANRDRVEETLSAANATSADTAASQVVLDVGAGLVASLDALAAALAPEQPSLPSGLDREAS